MLYYTEIGLSPYEVPNESSLCIYISGCCNRCKNCHYPLLQNTDYGLILKKFYKNIIELYKNQATCVCFLGEGKNKDEEHTEFEIIVKHVKKLGLKTCLYCGRDVEIENWMGIFDYVKLGSYNEALGDLSNPTTNQKLFKKTLNGYEDITHLFWEEV